MRLLWHHHRPGYAVQPPPRGQKRRGHARQHRGFNRCQTLHRSQRSSSATRARRVARLLWHHRRRPGRTLVQLSALHRQLRALRPLGRPGAKERPPRCCRGEGSCLLPPRHDLGPQAPRRHPSRHSGCASAAGLSFTRTSCRKRSCKPGPNNSPTQTSSQSHDQPPRPDFGLLR
jgi:hypothetical protein